MVPRDARDGTVVSPGRFNYGPYHRLYILGNVRRLKIAPSLSFEHYEMDGDPGDIAGNEKQFQRALDLGAVFESEEERAAIIKDALKGPVAAFLREFETEAGALRLFRRINDRNVFDILPRTEELMHE
jgi:hypothetical protein